jgi:hypothetical protein
MTWLLRIVAIISLTLAILVVAFIFALHTGISISDSSIAPMHFSDARLHWDNGLNLEVDHVSLAQAQTNQPDNEFSLDNIKKILYALNIIDDWFATIVIRDLTAADFTASLNYDSETGGHLVIESSAISVRSLLSINNGFLDADIEQFSSSRYNSKGTGIIRIDPEKLQLTASIDATIADTLPVSLKVNADTQQLSFSAKGKESISSIAPIVKQFDPGPVISPWIAEYLKTGTVSLQSVSGSIEYGNPASILHTLNAVVKATAVEYQFNQELEPIKADSADVIFKEGVLFIQPQKASFYGQDTGRSKLDINFSNKPFLLTADINTSAQASGGILTLLDHYGIPFPFEQKQGKTDTDLQLVINLSTANVSAQGTFKSVNSVFEFEQNLIDVASLDIELKNASTIDIHNLVIRKEDSFSSQVSGQLDLAEKLGDLQILIDSAIYRSGSTTLHLANTGNSPIKLEFSMRADGDSIRVNASTWKVGDKEIKVTGFDAEIDHQTWAGRLPATPVMLAPWLKATIAGTFNLTKSSANLDIRLTDLDYRSITLAQPQLLVNCVIDNDIKLLTKADTMLTVDSDRLRLSPAHVTLRDNWLYIQNSGIDVNKSLSAGITGQINLSDGTGSLKLGNIRIVDDAGSTLFLVRQQTKVNILDGKNAQQFNVPALGMQINIKSTGAWILKLNDFEKLHSHSPWMQKYKLHKGWLALSSGDGSLPYSITGELNYPETLIIKGDAAIHDYHFDGLYDGQSTSLNINNDSKVAITDTVTVDTSDIGFNLPAILSIVNHSSSRKRSTGVRKPALFTLNAANSFIYFNDGSRLLAETLDISISDSEINGDLKYGNGIARLNFADNTLSVIGQGLDHRFISALQSRADFTKGTMEFKISGNLNDLSGVFRIEDSVLVNYKTLNNILAFVNTVPSLLTFKVPDYSQKGLPAQEITGALEYRDGLMTIKSANIDSNELDVSGEGIVNLNDNNIDMTFNLITGAHKNVSRIPLIGFVISGAEKRPSVTLTVKGHLDKPDIEHTAFKEVATYPFQVLKRTVTLPGHLVENFQQKTDIEAVEKSESQTK